MKAANVCLLAVLLVLGSAAASRPGAPGMSNRNPNAMMKEKALYFITNNETANAIVSIPIDPMTGDLMESHRTMTYTGGKGASAFFMGEKATVDTLQTQQAIVVSDDLLFTVDAGSNTVSMWRISPNDPTSLRQIGRPADTLGDFPGTLAFDPVKRVLCVANGGALAGVACFRVSRAWGLSPMDKRVRTLSLCQSTPPMGPFHTVSQLMFDPSGSVLLALVKGEPPSGTAGFAAMYKVTGNVGTAMVDMTPTIVPTTGSVLPFGSVFFDGGSKIIISDPIIGGAATFDFDAATPSLQLATLQSMPAVFTLPEQMASCWACYSAATQTAFIIDTAGIMFEVDPLKPADAPLSILDADAGYPAGGLDCYAGSELVYTLAGGDGAIAITDISGGAGTAVVKRVVSGVVPVGSMGLAVYMGM